MGAAVSGVFVSGVFVSGAAVSGAAVSAALVSGAVVSGAFFSGAAVSGAFVSGAAVSGCAAGAAGSVFFSEAACVCGVEASVTACGTVSSASTYAPCWTVIVTIKSMAMIVRSSLFDLCILFVLIQSLSHPYTLMSGFYLPRTMYNRLHFTPPLFAIAIVRIYDFFS